MNILSIDNLKQKLQNLSHHKLGIIMVISCGYSLAIVQPHLCILYGLLELSNKNTTSEDATTKE